MRNLFITLLVGLTVTTFPIKLLAGQAVKSQPSTKVKVDRFDTQPFKGGVDVRLASFYKGHDANALALALLKRPTKDAYETTEQFQAKINVWESQPLLGNVKIGDQIAIRGSFLSLDKNYDADAGTMTFGFDPDYQVSANDSTTPFIIISSDKKTLPSVVGQTGMGVKFRYERKKFTEFGVKLQNISYPSSKYTFKVSPEIAKGNIVWDVLFVGTLSAPYVLSEESYHTPTLTESYEQIVNSRGIVLNVNEIIIFNSWTGGEGVNVIARIAVK
jgi:hypothetical protein